MKRPPGSGQLYEKWGSYYGRWRTPDGRRLNRKLGPARVKGGSEGLTRAQAEQAFRRIQSEEAARKPAEVVVEILTVDQVADRLRERVAIEGARKSYRQNLESMQPCISRRCWVIARLVPSRLRMSSGWRAGCRESSTLGPRAPRAHPGLTT